MRIFIMVSISFQALPQKIRIIHRLKPKLVCGTASFLLYLAEKARNGGIPFHRMGGVGILLSVGEPGAAIPATRERLLKGWSSRAVIDGFGITELFPMGGSCPGCGDTHISNDFVIVEVVDPETGEVLPPGMPGELVYTNIIGETQPLLRYRSRDMGAIAPFGPCPACGSTATRIVGGIQGRVDEMIWYKGINIFPSSVEAVVRGYGELTDEFEIVLEQDGDAMHWPPCSPGTPLLVQGVGEGEGLGVQLDHGVEPGSPSIEGLDALEIPLGDGPRRDLARLHGFL